MRPWPVGTYKILGDLYLEGIEPAEIPARQKVKVRLSLRWSFKVEAWEYLKSYLGWEYWYRYRWRTLVGVNLNPGGFFSIRDSTALTGSRTIEIEVGPFEPGTLFTVSAEIFAEYYRDSLRCLFGKTACITDATTTVFGEDGEARAKIYVVQKLPTCSFTVRPATIGEAPFVVDVADTSTAPIDAPIRSWLWNFGDGITSRLPALSHTYTKPGTYTLSLTVTNDYGSDSARTTITVLAALVFPIFLPSPTSYFPASVNVDQAFTPRLVIRNQGGPGAIFVKCVAAGYERVILQSQAISGYTDYTVPIGAHTIDWYLGYTPQESQYANIWVYTGPVGQQASSQLSFTVAVIVPVTPPTYYTCPYCGAQFTSQEALDEHIKSQHPEEVKKNYLPYIIGGGLLALGLGAVLYAGRKK